MANLPPDSPDSPDSPDIAATPRTSARLILILGALVAFAPLSIDMYLPALPQIARHFNATTGAAQYTLAAYFIGMALGQSVYGSLSDHYGRKPPLYWGFALYVLASLGCALAPNLASLLACRFFQALGGCVGMVIPLAMVGDLYDQQTSARILSRLMLVMGAAPMLAPLLGAQLLSQFGWRAIFVVLAAGGLAALIALHLGLQETRPPSVSQTARAGQTSTPTLSATLRVYGRLLTDRPTLAYCLANACAFAGMFAYIAGAPGVLIQLYGLSPLTFSWAFGFNAFGLIAASQLNHKLLAYWRADAVLMVALSIMALLGFGLLWASHAAADIKIVLPLLFGFVSCIGLISPNASAGAMASNTAQAGSASALLGTLEFGIATLAGAAVGFFNDGSAHAMGMVMALCGMAALASYQILPRPTN